MNYIALENILESLDPREIRSIENGPNKVEAILDKSIDFVTKQEYDESSALDRSIKKIDIALEDLNDEKKKVSEGNVGSKYRFTATYIINIAVTLVTSIAAINGALAVGNPVPMVTAVAAIFKNGIPDDIKNLTLSITDYDKLIDHYESKLKVEKSKLESQLNKIESFEKKGSKMEIKEYNIPEGASDIKYMSPDDLEVKNRAAQVLHDEDIKNADPAPSGSPVGDPVPVTPNAKPFTPVCGPMDAVMKAKADYCSDPKNMQLTKFNGKYYIAYDDLKNYMDGSCTSNYANALNNIIKAHDDTKDLGCDTLKVIMNSSQFNNCSNEERARMESASVDFEICD